MKRTGTTRDRGTTHNTPPPPFNKTTMRTRRGAPMTNGRVSAIAPALPPLCRPPSQRHPTIHDGPTHHHERGERTEDTPPHEQHRHTPTTHTPRTWQETLCDMTAVLASTAMGWVGHEPHHCTGQDSSSTYHRHSTHRGGWTPSTHPLIYSYSFVFTQSTNNNEQ